jgi:hypothetical protein
MTPTEVTERIIKAIINYPGAAYPKIEIETIVRQAKTEWCKEQRKICVNTYWEKIGKNSITFLIANASEPK